MESVAVESILWTYQDSTSISTRELIHENPKIIQEFYGYNSDRTLMITTLSSIGLKKNIAELQDLTAILPEL